MSEDTPKTTAKKTTSRKNTAKKAVAKKTAPRKATAKKAPRRTGTRKSALPTRTPAANLTAAAIKEVLGTGKKVEPGADERHRMIAQRAYRIAVKRGFQNGDPLEDWLAAEAEIEAEIASVRCC